MIPSVDSVFYKRLATSRTLNRTADSAFYNIQNAGATYCDEYIAILNRATALGIAWPSFNSRVIQDKLLRDLKFIGAWNQIDALYVFKNSESLGFAGIDWKSPTRVSSFTAGFTVDALGVSCNAALNSYAFKTGVFPNTLSSFQSNSGSIFSYVSLFGAGYYELWGCLDGASTCDFYYFSTLNRLLPRMNGDGSMGAGILPKNAGLTLFQKIGLSNVKLLQNGLDQGAITMSINLSRPSNEMWVFNANNSGVGVIASPSKLSLWGIGGVMLGIEASLKTVTDNFYNS